MKNFKLVSKFKPQGDQAQAIDDIVKLLKSGNKHQTVLGVTGSGKTYVMAKVIETLNKPTLIISHNKTLAAQLASEFSEFFPNNAVSYFVSYYDYYQPEAYIAKSDTYIEKETTINEEIDRLRQLATHNLLTRKDVIIVASVSCIYGLGSPIDYQGLSVVLEVAKNYKILDIAKKLTFAQFSRNDHDFKNGTFRIKGDVLDIFPSAFDFSYRIDFFGDKIEKILKINPLTGEVLASLKKITIYPAKHWVAPQDKIKNALEEIEQDLNKRIAYFKKQNKLLEAQRIEQRTKFDLEILRETGFVNGIENYSRYFDGRQPGEPPFTLMDYFPSDYLLFIDESHITIPQIGGMYFGDKSRKNALVDYGFRLESALDNRPLTFEEFSNRINQVTYVSATPREYELSLSAQKEIKDVSEIGKEKIKGIARLIVRPTGILDPEIEVRKTKNQIDDLISEVKKRVGKKQRVLITTLTKRMAEDLAEYLAEISIKVAYIHSEVETFERLDLLRDLREGKYDCLVGINLLREGLDLPEVSLVIILDADKEGFLRSESSLIQVMGRAARHIEGKVIMYADTVTGSMKRAINATKTRRAIQENFNKINNIKPTPIVKKIASSMRQEEVKETHFFDIKKMSKGEAKLFVKHLEGQMELAAKNLEFEKAAVLRDQILETKNELERKKISGK